jgi:peptide/nickel transport system ATP-binding protein
VTSTPPVVEAAGLYRHYRLPRRRLTVPGGVVYALNGVSFTISRGQSLGIVGESGCGKSTLARCVMALEPLTEGRLVLFGRDPATMTAAELRRHRRHFQMVFQDPYGSLDPRHTVARIVAEPLDVAEPGLPRSVSRARVQAVLDSVGLGVSDLDRYPHEFSGGQRQRIAIARALVTRPALIVADEPVSALDVSVRAQVLNLMQELQDRFGVAYLMISHDLAVVEYVCDEIAVMYLGRFVERGPAERIFSAPAHPYTQALLASVPRLVPGRRRRSTISGGVPSATALPAGCGFADRCPRVVPRCRVEAPGLREVAPGQFASCHLA